MDLIGSLLPERLRPYAKAVVAVVAVVLSALCAAGNHATLSLILQVLGALGVYAQPNADPAPVD